MLGQASLPRRRASRGGGGDAGMSKALLGNLWVNAG